MSATMAVTSVGCQTESKTTIATTPSIPLGMPGVPCRAHTLAFQTTGALYGRPTDTFAAHGASTRAALVAPFGMTGVSSCTPSIPADSSSIPPGRSNAALCGCSEGEALTPSAMGWACPDSSLAPAKSENTTESAEPNDAMRMPPRASLSLVLFMSLLRGINLVIVIPTADDYAQRLGAGTLFSGLSIGLVPLLACIGIFMNHWMLKHMSMKTILIILSIGAFSGNVLYALAGLTRSKFTILVARALIGMSSGSLLMQMYIAIAVGSNRRSEIMFYLTASVALGYAAGPALAALLEVFVKEIRIENLVLDSDTAPGWLLAILNFILLVLVVLVFQEPPQEEPVKNTVAARVGHPLPTAARAHLPALGLTACCWTMCVAGMMMTNCEVFSTFLGKDVWGWSIDIAAWYLAGVMLVAGIASLLLGQLLQRHPLQRGDRAGLLAASTVSMVCCVPLFDFGLQSILAQASIFATGLLLVLSVVTAMRSFAMSLVTKIAPASLKANMSLYAMASNAAGRGLGAILASALTMEIFAAVQVGLFLVTIVICSVGYKQLEAYTKEA